MSVVVCDASAVVAALVDAGADGAWVDASLRGHQLAAPALLDFEVANILRRHELAGLISPDVAAQAHHDLGDLAIERWPYATVRDRVWELRGAVTAYDASYVTVAEMLGTSVVTLDRRLGRASGLRCPVLTPA